MPTATERRGSAALDGFLPNADLSFGLLGTELWSRAGLMLAAAARAAGSATRAPPSSPATCSARAATGWRRPSARRAHTASWRPWVLHTGLGPDAAASGFMTQVIAVAIQEGGMPVPKGGGARLVDALVRLIEDNAGSCRTGAEVASIVVRNGTAEGVRTTGGETIGADKALLANVTPTQLYGPLLGHPAGAVAEAGRRFRYGRAEMQIHFALSELPRWNGDERLEKTAIVHVTPGLDGVSRAVNEAERGLLPAEATVVCGQPLAVDPSRAPAGKGMLWIQLQELPWEVKGDAAGELDPGDGSWTEELRERYADRIQERLAGPHPESEGGGDPPDVSLAGRPAGRQPEPASRRPVLRVARARPELPLAAVPGTPGASHAGRTLWHIGASTWPGPGLGAGSGTLVALELLKVPVTERILQRFRRRPASP